MAPPDLFSKKISTDNLVSGQFSSFKPPTINKTICSFDSYFLCYGVICPKVRFCLAYLIIDKLFHTSSIYHRWTGNGAYKLPIPLKLTIDLTTSTRECSALLWEISNYNYYLHQINNSIIYLRPNVFL